jgi:hypothetical protein
MREKTKSASLINLGVSLLFMITPLCAWGEALEMNGNVAVTGTLSATSFSGSAAGLTNIPGSAIAGTSITVNQLADGAVTPVKIGFLGKVAIVATSGGDYSNPATAMGDYVSWCGAPSANNPCLLKIMPGVYNVGTSPVIMQPYIDIEGSGESLTIITGSVSDLSFPPANGLVNGASNAEIRLLTVKNTGSGGYKAAMLNNGASPRMTHMTAAASGGTCSYGVLNHSSSSSMTNITAAASGGGTSSYGVYNSTSSPTMTNVTATASGGTWSNGVYNDTSSPIMNSVTATASGGTYNSGVYNSSSSPTMTSVTATASGGTSSSGVFNQTSSPTMTNVIATASDGGEYNRGVANTGLSSPTMINITAASTGGNYSYAVYNLASSPTMTNVSATASGGTSNCGLYNSAPSGSYTIKIDRSTFSGLTNSILNDSHFTLWIGATNLTGGAVNASGTYHCVGVYDGDDYTSLSASCQ